MGNNRIGTNINELAKKINGLPIARLRDMQMPPPIDNPDAIYNDIADTILHTEGKAYRNACLAGTPDDIASTAESLKLAIVRALKTNAKPEPRYYDNNDTCGNG